MHFKEIPLGENEKHLYDILDTHMEKVTSQSRDTGCQFSLAAYENDTYLGGITAKKWLQEVHISLLGVVPNARHQGIAQKLMTAGETFAKEKAATVITITTQDFQAKDFYEKLGYKVFGQLQDCPFEGTTRYYLEKRIH